MGQAEGVLGMKSVEEAVGESAMHEGLGWGGGAEESPGERTPQPGESLREAAVPQQPTSLAWDPSLETSFPLAKSSWERGVCGSGHAVG